MRKAKLQLKIQNSLLATAVAFILVLIAVPVFAAELFFGVRDQEFTRGDDFLASIFLNTEGESINAVEGKIFFPENVLEVKEIRDGNSIINFWIERPMIEQAGIIGFSGIIPGGYQEKKGFLFSVVFQAKTNDNDTIEIHDAKVLLNDGKGTPANLSISNFQFTIAEEVPAAPLMVETIKDTEPPEDFKPEIAQSPEMFEEKWFLVFATQDKGSGIDYYVIHESRWKKEVTRISAEKWIKTESPYLLKDQKLRSYIYVKATDKAGNERIVIVEPRYPLKWYENWWILVIIVLLAGVIFYSVRRFLWRELYTKIHK